jgi:hypothetical protein
MVGVYHRGWRNFRLGSALRGSQLKHCHSERALEARVRNLLFRDVMYAVEQEKMTPNDFRRLALALPEATESAHMDHPDFRVSGKVFATLGYPDKEWAMVKLTPEQQHYFCKDHPDIFVPVKGAWGRKGATNVALKAAKKEVVAEALRAAWEKSCS